jgi:hypothetical protein
MLIRDANSLCSGQLDAGLAAEVAVTKLIRSHLAGIGHPNTDGELRRNRMLGPLCEYWTRQCSGNLPTDNQARLLTRRNNATHAGALFAESDVRDAITVARDIVNQAMPLPL